MRLSALFLALIVADPARARISLGTFDGWGAFRDERPLRCFAIAEPIRARGGAWRPFASIANWPRVGVRGQLHIRLARARRNNVPVALSIGTRRFDLVAGGADAWAPDPRADAAITAAMRSADAMTVRTRAANGSAMSDTYVLKGAATAMDAATLGCARR